MNAGDIAPGPLARALLFVPGTLYGLAVRARNRLYDAGWLPSRSLPALTVAFGNLTVGGTGKTPLTAYAAGALAESGYRVAILSRGYRRRGSSAPLLVSDGHSLRADAMQAGDEAALMARDLPSIPVAVGADRVAAARLLVECGSPEVILLDDAFQHRGVARDLNLLLVDGSDPWGNGRMLPFGPLREPVSSLSRADAVIVTRSDGTCPAELKRVLERHHSKAPLMHAQIRPRRFVRDDGEPADLAALRGFAAYAFSGIARPERFEADLAHLGLRLVGRRRFPDHHPYSPPEIERLRADARACGAEVLVTTEKDRIRIAALPGGAPPLVSLALGVSFPPDADLAGFLLDRLRDLSDRRAGRLSR